MKRWQVLLLAGLDAGLTTVLGVLIFTGFFNGGDWPYSLSGAWLMVAEGHRIWASNGPFLVGLIAALFVCSAIVALVVVPGAGRAVVARPGGGWWIGAAYGLGCALVVLTVVSLIGWGVATLGAAADPQPRGPRWRGIMEPLIGVVTLAWFFSVDVIVGSMVLGMVNGMVIQRLVGRKVAR